jgi:tyrosyl-tRNA synthetase
MVLNLEKVNLVHYGLDAELTSPYEIYQYFVNASDADVGSTI